jgi:hypothetical protein
MEEQVYRIWTVLSAFEESSAACISEMLRHVSSGQYIEGVRMAEKFVLHVETLFSAIDDLSDQFKDVRAKGKINHKYPLAFFSLTPSSPRQKLLTFGNLECCAKRSSTSSRCYHTRMKQELGRCR